MQIDKLYQSIEVIKYASKGQHVFDEVPHSDVSITGSSCYDGVECREMQANAFTWCSRAKVSPLVKLLMEMVPIEVLSVEILHQWADSSSNEATGSPSARHIAFLHPGDTFGERALLYESDRRAGERNLANQ